MNLKVVNIEVIRRQATFSVPILLVRLRLGIAELGCHAALLLKSVGGFTWFRKKEASEGFHFDHW